MAAMRFCLVRPTADFGSDVQYSGGLHGFRCIAETLSASGHDVHVLYCASKSQLLYEAMLKGCMLQLSHSQAVEGVALLKEQGVTHHIGLTDAEESTQEQLSGAMAMLGNSSNVEQTLPLSIRRLVTELQYLTHRTQQQQTWVMLDADGSQEPLYPAAFSLLEACVHFLDPKHVLLLVQNIHFLPFGPAGTATRSPGILSAWSKLGGVICCSKFVAEYVWQHARPLGLTEHQLTVTHYATWRAFGQGPFKDVSLAAAQTDARTDGNASETGQQQQPQQQRPVVGCLKLTPEKGGQLFLSLAQQMPHLNFLAAATDPGLQQQAAALALNNLKLIPPAADVGTILQHMTLLLAPSLWQEAYGMVVTDAVLRGIPVIVSNQGGLAEAALGVAAAVVPVNPMTLPVDQNTGCCSWKHRQFPTDQPVQQWIDAIQEVVSSRELYQSHSNACWDVGQQLLRQQPELLQQFFSWLQQLT